MTETTELPTTTGRTSRGTSLSSMVLTDLKRMASEMGIKGISGMRKGELVAAISERRNGGGSQAGSQTATTGESTPPSAPRARRAATRSAGAADPQPALTDSADDGATSAERQRPEKKAPRSNERGKKSGNSSSTASDHGAAGGTQASANSAKAGNKTGLSDDESDTRSRSQDQPDEGSGRGSRRNRDERNNDQRDSDDDDGDRNRNSDRNVGRDRNNDGNSDRDRNKGRDRNNDRDGNNDLDGNSDGGRRRGRRYRDRNRKGGRDRRPESNEPELREDDVLVPISGVVDVLDSYAFVRTSGYLAGSKDVYVSMSQVRKYGLRRGDMVTGSIRAPRDGEQQSQRQKYTPLAKLDTINELDPEQMRGRPEFTKLTPLYPNDRLRLETTSDILTTRVIDLVMPVGKGQRALIVSPPKAGKTMILQAVANAIATNNPECHLMVVLVDERPEEVTDMQRSVRGEVIASTFDRPPSDHTSVAELSIERAKRLVEMGKDVVVLLDSITRLGRAYNLAAPASGRILSGGVDSTALFPPKRFLGAARNIENGGSLTIFASALVETGSAGDTVIYEEFKGTGNAELKLDRRLSDKRLFPAIDLDSSSTRKEELLMGADELAVTVKLRRVLSALEPQQALELVLDKLRKSTTNIEFLMTVAKNMPMKD